MLKHPNVAHVLDAGVTSQGRPFFAMEYIAGVPITVHCDEHRLSTLQRLNLFRQACAALQHAHQKGLIHREIKPSNVMVASHESGPIVKVIDFGVAKAVDQRSEEASMVTESGQLVGTPEYMSPEQAQGLGDNIDTRIDIYSLGVLLYELLVGTIPFDSQSLRSGGYAEIQRMICDEEPLKPSSRFTRFGEQSTEIASRRSTEPNSLKRQLRGDLDWITMKAMSKDRDRRYSSAAEFAQDIEKHLNSEPVLASPPTAAYRLRKFVRRNRTGVVAALVVFVVLVGGIVGTTSNMLRAIRAEKKAVLAAEAETVQRMEADEARDKASANMLRALKAEENAVMAAKSETAQRIVADESRDKARKESAKANAINDFLINDMLSSASPIKNGGRKITVEEAVRNAVDKVGIAFADQPDVKASMHIGLGAIFHQLGDYDAALTQRINTVETYRDSQGEETSDSLRAIQSLATTYWKIGKLEEAKSYINQAIEVYRRHPEYDRVHFGEAVNSFGNIVYRQGEYEDAALLYAEALALKREGSDGDTASIASTIGNLANVKLSLGQHDAAVIAQRESLAIWLRLTKKEPPEASMIEASMGMHNLAAMLTSAGKLEESEELLRETLRVRKEVYGRDHTDIAETLIRLGELSGKRKQYKESKEFFLQALDMKRTLLGPGALSVGEALGFYVTVLSQSGDLEAALEAKREQATIYKNLLSLDNPRTIISMSGLATLHYRLKQYQKAAQIHEETRTHYSQVFKQNDWRQYYFQCTYGRTLILLKRYEESEKLLLESYEALERIKGRANPYTKASAKYLVQLYETLGKLSEIERWILLRDWKTESKTNTDP